jgi:two-component system sensor histidine kinase HydH
MGTMTRARRAVSGLLLPLVIIVLPAVLLVSSLRTFNELKIQKTVYLRNRVAAVAGRLETLPETTSGDALYGVLSEDEPSLISVELLSREQTASSGPSLEPLWDGRELFRTETLETGGFEIFRAWVPFHSSAGLRLARIDLDAGAADFLITHSRHNVIVSSLGGLVLVALSLYAIWATRRAARMEVRQLELEHLAQLGEMSAVLAHESRNPLGTIKGFAQLIGEQEGAGTRGLIDPILSETQRLESLVSDLLLYGRPPSPAIRWTRWEEVLSPLKAHAERLAQKSGVHFLADEPAVQWRTDPQLLLQALLNLLRNAFEAAGGRDGAEVRLEVHLPPSGGLAVAVVDNGPGIPPEVKAKLFKPFFTTKTFGTGLGLSITRALARSLGGELTLGDAPPQGTTAELRFPKASPQAVDDRN